ncbi:acyl-CoA dehydrogenase family protein [Saccharopolyspora phatthalungensis]|uniref:Alkylation response protein AidB-like acyl-CoA dehydrogenase n=1 Tax=Saccharopolyspora phatthalungensis TaxID=664693 RepID=A0A840QCY5_9PSEU|nr:acyl-CoA dehydrogenase family protein [Saccharopolyspora phatthalungensis]MBB5158256.1 alkylation response protein AidB-like acyl-CoA dehydrogenase [Saccharopolyspora phatthalungensis]
MDLIDQMILTDAHHALRHEVQEFAAEVIAPQVAKMEETSAVDHEVIREVSRRGYIGVTIPRRYGGMGGDHKARTLLIETISSEHGSGAMGAATQASILGLAKILHFGSEEQKQQWLPAIAAGECLPTIATTEPGCGGHVLGMEATAVRDGSDWILNGHKHHVGNSHVADLHGVVVRTGEGSGGLSAFLVPADTPGCYLGEHVPLTGLRGFSAGDVFFEDCRVPASALLGEEGDGLSVALSSSMLYGRANLAAVSCGVHRALLADTKDEVKRRHRYGKPLHEALDSVQQKIGKITSNVMTARQDLYLAVDALDRGMDCDAALANAKLINVELALASARLADGIYGADAHRTDRALQRYVRDSQPIRSPAGTSEIQQRILYKVTMDSYPSSWSVRLADKVAGAELRH